MAEYINKEIIIRILQRNFREISNANDAMQQSIDDVWEMQAADVVEAVRCETCAHFKSIDDKWCYYHATFVDEDGYCSSGVRRAE